MKSKRLLFIPGLLMSAFGLPVFAEFAAVPGRVTATRAVVDNGGEGSDIRQTDLGPVLSCRAQRLEGLVTTEGLWLTSTSTDAATERFRVRATHLARASAVSRVNLVATGVVSAEGTTVRFLRAGLVEEYSVGREGVRQDFLVSERLHGTGELVVRLEVSGARAERAVHGIRLVPVGSTRKLAYSRLQVTDATGRTLPARMELEQTTNAEGKLALVVDDAAAVYPVRIDPTFSDEDWVGLSGFTGASAEVYASVVDGAGDLYVGGSFTILGATLANRVARWDGNEWSALGSGVDSFILSMATMNGDLYVGGAFSTAGGLPAANIARWNGTAWSPVGGGLNSSVNVIHVLGNELYVGGDFTFATNSGGAAVRVNRVARWDGTNWSALGRGLSSTCSAVTTSGGSVYVGGAFSMATNSGGVPVGVSSIARWDGTNWSNVGGGLGHHLPPPGGVSYVYKLAALGTDLYASGEFTIATNTGGGTLRVNKVARWDGTSWFAMGEGLNSWVTGFELKGSNLYVGGAFTWATNTGGAAVAVNRIAIWDGTNWSALNGSLGNAIRTLAWRGEELFVGGDFTTATNSGNQPVTVNRIARWNGSSWLPFGSAINNVVRALEVAGADLYVGGNFTAANNDGVGNVPSRGIARWSGGQWSGLGFGVNGNVNALALAGSELYVGGTFTFATNGGGGGVSASRIARWNGATWSALAGGLNGLVEAVKVSGSNVYVGGLFTVATNTGGVPVTVNRVACWNGSAWLALGMGLNGTVNALAVSSNALYAGGIFLTATNGGGAAVTVNRVARWDGANWSALGAGLGSSVGALLVSGTDLYAGANPGVVRWDGGSWTSLGPGLNGSATELAMLAGDLFACGSFSTATNLAGTVTANRVARWDGANWSALGSGLNNSAWALAPAGNDLYVGGDFSAAGGKLAFYLARARLSASPGLLLMLTTNGLPGFTNGQFRLAVSGPAGSNVVIQASSNLQTWDSVLTNPLDGGLLLYTDSQSSSLPQRFYRALLE